MDPHQVLVQQIEELMERFEQEEQDKQKEREEEDARTDRDAKREEGEADLQPLTRMIHGSEDEPGKDRENEPSFDEGR